jgi:hypothetical protein
MYTDTHICMGCRHTHIYMHTYILIIHKYILTHIHSHIHKHNYINVCIGLCETASVVLWSEFLATEVLGSIPGASRFSEKQWVWNGVHSASSGQLRSYLEEKVAAPV